MFWDIVIGIGLAILTVIMMVLGGLLAATKKWHRWVFYLSGTLMFALIALQTVRNTQTQAELNKTLEKIERNTRQRPPAPLVAWEKMESIHRVYINGVPSGAGIGLVQRQVIGFNIYFINNGNATAHNTAGVGKVYLVPDSKHEQQLIARFKNDVDKIKNSLLRTDLDPGGHEENWFTAKSDRVVTAEDIKKLVNGRERLYLLFTEFYNDSTGSHYQNYCKLLQPPAFDPEVWQLCEDFSDRQ
jgi:hypothetical protein